MGLKCLNKTLKKIQFIQAYTNDVVSDDRRYNGRLQSRCLILEARSWYSTLLSHECVVASTLFFYNETDQPSLKLLKRT